MSETTRERPGFVTSLVLGIIAVVIGVVAGIASGAVWWGVGFIVLGVAWIIYAIVQRRRRKLS